jgi:hypothetical protein
VLELLQSGYTPHHTNPVRELHGELLANIGGGRICAGNTQSSLTPAFIAEPQHAQCPPCAGLPNAMPGDDEGDYCRKVFPATGVLYSNVRSIASGFEIPHLSLLFAPTPGYLDLLCEAL